MPGLFSHRALFLPSTALGNGLWEVQVLKGLEQSLYFKTHLLKAAKRVPTSESPEHLTDIIKPIVIILL